MKKIQIFDFNYLLISFFAILSVFLVITVFINGFENTDIGLARLGIGIAFIINYFLDVKNRIKTITVDNNSIILEITKAFKKNKIIINRNKIVSLRMFIYTTYPSRICLNFCLKNNDKNEFIDIYYDIASQSIIKQLYVLKDYISDFSYSISPENSNLLHSWDLYIKNNFQNSLKDKVYNIIMFIACLLAVIIVLGIVLVGL